MDLAGLQTSLDPGEIGENIYRLITELYPLCRSITGNGLRETLRALQKQIPLAIHEVPSGTRVFDWTVPKEWNIVDAYVRDGRGRKVIDFRDSNLHVVGYSTPIRTTMPLAALKAHLFTLPDRPDWIPYRTSYYKEDWGFCLAHRRLEALGEEDYEVVIDSALTDGHLTYGEYVIPGATPDEILVSCHTCHPSLCNDNLSGVALAAMLARHLGEAALRYTYRFLFIPGTIGAITWLALNEASAPRIKHGLVVVCVGDAGRPTYKRSRRGNAAIDRAAAHVLAHSGGDYEIVDFVPYGYDERQYCSPGFDLPVGSLSRTPHARFAEYHTSADDLSFVQPRYLADSFAKYLAVLAVLEGNRRYLNTNPKCEPQLGRRGLYRAVGGGHLDSRSRELALLWVLNLSDGSHALLDIAERSGLPFPAIKAAADALVEHGLLVEASISTKEGRS